MPRYTEIGERIKAFADSRGLSNSALAREVGVGRSSVTGWVSGEYRPDGENLERLSVVLGVSPSQIMGFEEKPPVNQIRVMAALTRAKAAHRELEEAIRELEMAHDLGKIEKASLENSERPVSGKELIESWTKRRERRKGADQSEESIGES